MRIAQSSRSGAPRAACANAHQRGTCEHTRSFDMDVLLEDASAKIEVKLLSPKAVEEAMHAWKEERKGDRNKGSEYAKLDRRRRVLTTEIERLSYAIANSRRKPDELLKRIDECDLERENVEERMRLLGGGSENVIPFDHPKFSDRYRSELKRLVIALKTNPKAIENRAAFRNLIDCIVVHPVRKRMPYEYTPYLNSAALNGKHLFRENHCEAGEISTFAYYDNGKSGKAVLPDPFELDELNFALRGRLLRDSFGESVNQIRVAGKTRQEIEQAIDSGRFSVWSMKLARSSSRVSRLIQRDQHGEMIPAAGARDDLNVQQNTANRSRRWKPKAAAGPTDYAQRSPPTFADAYSTDIRRLLQNGSKSLKSLALPRGIEPLFQP
ncbi:hypothetical protein [Bradyrhizobium ottawaense]|uniref:hypothetical protein n=1 Tax=Bradyrhizobium ottawaense TaxID=931866 RepID=UPI003516660B